CGGRGRPGTTTICWSSKMFCPGWAHPRKALDATENTCGKSRNKSKLRRMRPRREFSCRTERLMSSDEVVFHSDLNRESGVILDLPRERAKWQWMSFFVHRLAPGETVQLQSDSEEIAMVLLGGKCTADWGEGQQEIGERANVFDGLPYA